MDVSRYERAGGTDAGGYYMLAPNVLLARPNDGYAQTVDGARASLVELRRIAEERGQAQVLVVLLDRVHSQDPGSRRVWAKEVDPAWLAGLALVGSTGLARAIAAFFLGLRRPKVPTKMFGSIDAAIAWGASTSASSARGTDG